MTHQQALETMAAERYLLDEMTEIEKHAFEDHFFDCSDCAHEVRLGEQIRAEVRSSRDARFGVPDSGSGIRDSGSGIRPTWTWHLESRAPSPESRYNH